jgi:hypothetical protein
MRMDLHRLAEERSLAYHRRVATLLPQRPDLFAKAKQRAQTWATSGESHSPYAERWLALLEGRIEALLAALVDPSERARALRQATPFAGALDPRERWTLWKEVRQAMEVR